MRLVEVGHDLLTLADGVLDQCVLEHVSQHEAKPVEPAPASRRGEACEAGSKHTLPKWSAHLAAMQLLKSLVAQ